MASGVFDDALIKHLWSSDEFRAIFSDANRVQKWYDFEAALALEQADLGIIPRAAADEIAAQAKGRQRRPRSDRRGNPAHQAPARAGAARAAGRCARRSTANIIHFGPTTQDVLDTGTVLQMKDAHAVYLRDLKAIGRELYRLSERHGIRRWWVARTACRRCRSRSATNARSGSPKWAATISA